MALILCLETATHLCSVALCRDGAVIASRDLLSTGYTHAEKLNVFVDEVMKEAGVAMPELDAVAVGIGPGSFTGLRIGLSAAKGLCYPLGIPIMGIGTLDTLCEAARLKAGLDGMRLWPMVDARRMEVFTRTPEGDGVAAVVLSEEWMAALDKSRKHAMFGEGADKAGALFAGAAHAHHLKDVVPVAGAMGGLAETRFRERVFDDLAYLTPLYGKEAGVTMTKKG
ncbi:MAG: tRNA (adenosine(37)-N6)-threonylcarbamoyltransferase complex dimerization subunit type 1 TsaB [Flavobacteriales bacterium]|nr:MAG: tRNA (adenosine(37)-N6)-threonylcarbamoyltransferase complex dimerization subunit type 1 TsaB [Flavobacteriales bacterium]